MFLRSSRRCSENVRRLPKAPSQGCTLDVRLGRQIKASPGRHFKMSPERQITTSPRCQFGTSPKWSNRIFTGRRRDTSSGRPRDQYFPAGKIQGNFKHRLLNMWILFKYFEVFLTGKLNKYTTLKFYSVEIASFSWYLSMENLEILGNSLIDQFS